MIETLKLAFHALQPLSNIGIHRERENITQSQIEFAREVVRDISVALDCQNPKTRKGASNDRTCKIFPFHSVGSDNPDLVGFKGGTMISDYNDPAGPMTDIDKNILELRKLLRVSSGPDLNQIIACCQSIRRDLSSIEDWAFQKGKEHV